MGDPGGGRQPGRGGGQLGPRAGLEVELPGSLVDQVHRFVVTTRPLAKGELEPLRPHTGASYQLRPLDDAGLARFAQLWFAAHRPESAAEDAAGFLDDVNDARLRQQLGLPLLATIAARLRGSGGQLPRSRTELYGEFIRHLVHERSANTHAHLVQQLGHVYVKGVSLADVLLSRRDAVLDAAAAEYLRDGSLLGAALAVLDTGDALLPPDWPDAVRTLLLGTGLVVREGDVLAFLHRSFAEYLASAQIAAEVGPSVEDIYAHVDEVIYPSGTSNLARFVIERWGQRPDSQVGRLLGWYILYERHRHALPAAVELLHCGLPIEPKLEQMLVVRLSNRVWSGDVRSALLLGELIDRPVAYDTLRSLGENAEVDASVRVVINDILARSAPQPDGRTAGVEALRHWAGDPTQDAYACYLAACALVSLDAESGLRALRRLVDGDDGWGRAAAAERLAQLGEVEEMTAVVRSIAHDPSATPTARLQAITAIRNLGHEREADAALRGLAAAPVTAQPGWLEVARTLQRARADYDASLDLYQRIAVQGIREERIESATELRNGGKTDLARAALTALVDDPGILDDRLLSALASVFGETGAAEVLRAAADPNPRWRHAIDAGVGMVRIGKLPEAITVLRAVLGHPEPAAWIAAARALCDNQDYVFGRSVLLRLAGGHGPLTRARVSPEVQVAATVALLASAMEAKEDKLTGTVHKLARKTNGVLTAAASIVAEADVDERYAVRYARILSDLLDDVATRNGVPLRLDAATALLNTTDHGRERALTELRIISDTATDPAIREAAAAQLA